MSQFYVRLLAIFVGRMVQCDYTSDKQALELVEVGSHLHCLCRRSFHAGRCAKCGHDVTRVQRVMDAFEPQVVTTLWDCSTVLDHRTVSCNTPRCLLLLDRVIRPAVDW